jgi:hypothetical protein
VACELAAEAAQPEKRAINSSEHTRIKNRTFVFFIFSSPYFPRKIRKLLVQDFYRV